MAQRAVGAEAIAARPAGLASTSWTELAACRQMGHSRFFAQSSSAARSICARCGVDEICFWFAMAHEEQVGYRSGVWGHTTPAMRKEIAALIGPGYAQRRLAAVLARWRAEERVA